MCSQDDNDRGAPGCPKSDDDVAKPGLPPAPPDPDHPQWSPYWSAFADTFAPDLERFARRYFSHRLAPERARDAAEDATASFVTHLMARRVLTRAGALHHPKAFLRKAFTRWIQSNYRRLSAQKRGGGWRRADLDVGRIPAPDTAASDIADAEWLVPALNDAVRQLAKRKRGSHFLVAVDLIRGKGKLSPQLCARLGLDAKNVALRIHRTRRALLAELVRAVRHLTPDRDTAQERVEWLHRQVLPRSRTAPLALSR